MFNNEFMVDVYFVVGFLGVIRMVFVYKYVLVVGSFVFYVMFYGDLVEVKFEIYILDVEFVVFLIFLKYMYSDEIDLEVDMVLVILYVVKKYIVLVLVKVCVNFLEISLEVKNVCVLLF